MALSRCVPGIIIAQLLRQIRRGFFGNAISFSGDGKVLAIGSMNKGRVKIYQYNEATNWTQLSKDIVSGTDDDYHAVSVSLSKDGQMVAIGDWNYGAGGNFALMNMIWNTSFGGKLAQIYSVSMMEGTLVVYYHW